MTTSGTYAFAPSLGQLVLYAFNRCGIRPTALLQEHMESARMAANLVCADFSNRGVNLWQVDLFTQALTQGTSTYSMNPNIVVMLDTYISTPSGPNTIDRLILPVSRSEYAAYPNKAQQAPPTVYWNDRLLAPTVTVWPVPDAAGPYTLKSYVLRQLQDAALENAVGVDIPYLWQKAFSDALSVELAVSWAPERLGALVPMALASYQAAADTNTELAQFYVSPMVSGYWRN